jgi:riboflavin biosynthesis pyrimidine reductase
LLFFVAMAHILPDRTVVAQEERHTPTMRILLAGPPVDPTLGPGPADPAALARAYAVPMGTSRWLRANMVSTLDGAAQGSDGRSGTINTPADNEVFALARALCDAVLVGAGTARTEGYRPVRVADRYAALRAAAGRPGSVSLVAVTASSRLPPQLAVQVTATPVLAVTCATNPHLPELRDSLGHDGVIVSGTERVDLPAAFNAMAERGLRHVLCEGGPHLLGQLLQDDLVDELMVTLTPTVVGGPGLRIVAAEPIERAFRPALLLEQDGTLMGRWVRDRH